MPKIETIVEELDKKPPARPQMGKLHTNTYKNFMTESGRMVGENKTVVHFIQVRCEPNRFLQMLRDKFQGRVPCKVSYDRDVILGGYQEMGKQNSFSVVWFDSLSDGMLGWVDRRVHELDADLG